MCSYFFYWFFLLNSIYKEKTFSFVQNSIIFIRYLISIQSDMPISTEVIHPWASCFHVTCFRRNEENMKRDASRTRQKKPFDITIFRSLCFHSIPFRSILCAIDCQKHVQRIRCQFFVLILLESFTFDLIGTMESTDQPDSRVYSIGNATKQTKSDYQELNEIKTSLCTSVLDVCGGDGDHELHVLQSFTPTPIRCLFLSVVRLIQLRYISRKLYGWYDRTCARFSMEWTHVYIVHNAHT